MVQKSMGEILDSLKISHEQAIGGLILEADLGNLLKGVGGDSICHKQNSSSSISITAELKLGQFLVSFVIGIVGFFLKYFDAIFNL